MKYYKVNYNKLEHLFQINYHLILIITIVLFLILLVVSCIINVSHTISLVGVYNEGTLHFQINYKLSDVVQNGKYLLFNEKQTSYEIKEFLDYEIYDNDIYQNIELKVDDIFINNEVGIIKIHYNKEKLINFVLKLFN